MKKTSIFIIAIFIVVLFALSVNAGEIGFVNCNLLNVRVSPDTNSELVTQLERGKSFDIIYTDNGWYNIKLDNDKTGFVCAKYVTKNRTENVASGETAKKLVTNAYNYIGCKYSYGSSGPSAFDCSGFTSYLYRQVGYNLPRTSTSQGSYGEYVDKQNLAAGDLVFFSNRSDKRINHVGIYVGNDNFIHASTSVRGVVVDNLNSSYYLRNYVTARRIL